MYVMVYLKEQPFLKPLKIYPQKFAEILLQSFQDNTEEAVSCVSQKVSQAARSLNFS
jgi:hypothetical protein